MNRKRIIPGVIAAGLVAGIAVVGGVSTASAKAKIHGADIAHSTITSANIRNQSIKSVDIAPNGVGASEIRKDAVGTSEIRNGSIGTADLSKSVKALLAKAGTPGKQGVPGKNGTNGHDGAPGAPGKDGKDGQDAFVDQKFTLNAGKTIENIGGKYADRHTEAGTITLNQGTYLVTLTGDFYGTEATDATPDLQVSLRTKTGASTADLTAYTAPFPKGQVFGLASDGSPRGLEQTANVTGLVIVTEDNTTLAVNLFGYNPDGSAAGSGQFGAITKVDTFQINTK